MVIEIAPAFVAAAARILAALDCEANANAQHMTICILRSCWNHTQQSEDSFLGDRALLLMSLLKVDSRDNGYNLHLMYRVICIIREAQAEFKAECDRTREARIADMRARVAARRRGVELAAV